MSPNAVAHLLAELKKATEETRAELSQLSARLESLYDETAQVDNLEARLAVLEAKRGPGRPPKPQPVQHA